MRLHTLAELAAEQGIRLPEALTSHWPPHLHATDERGWFRFQRLYDMARACVLVRQRAQLEQPAAERVGHASR